MKTFGEFCISTAGIMERESSEGEPIENIPNLDIAFYIHHLRTTDDDEIAKKLLELIEKDAMVPLFEKVCESFVWCTFDEATLSQMQLVNFAELSILDNGINDAEESLDVTDLSESIIKKAEYCSKIGDKETALIHFKAAVQLELSMTRVVDVFFHCVRIGMFDLDYAVMRAFLNLLTKIFNFNWSSRNRLKIYEAVYCICVRDFRLACNYMVDTIPSFCCHEVMSYSRFIRYTVYVSMMILPRPDLKTKIIDNHEVTATLRSDPETMTYLFSLYNCNYAEFFVHLGIVEENLRKDHFFHLHYKYYVREMKVLIYAQLLSSYKRLGLLAIAEQFGVTEEFVENDIAKLISSGRLSCQINKLTRAVEMNRPDMKTQQYEMIIKRGDMLLTRLKKLSRIINF